MNLKEKIILEEIEDYVRTLIKNYPKMGEGVDNNITMFLPHILLFRDCLNELDKIREAREIEAVENL